MLEANTKEKRMSDEMFCCIVMQKERLIYIRNIHQVANVFNIHLLGKLHWKNNTLLHFDKNKNNN